MGSRQSFLILTVFVCIFTNNLNLAVATPEGEKDAYIMHVTYNAKIRAQTLDLWNLTVHNINCAENDQGEAWFFFRFYLYSELWWDEYNSTSYRTWLCNKGDTVSRGYQIKGWNILEPASYNLKIELYCFHNGTFHLEDAISSSIVVTMLMSLQHIYAFSYLAVYLIACFILLFFYYIAGLGLEE
jgi:hypothetical protein